MKTDFHELKINRYTIGIFITTLLIVFLFFVLNRIPFPCFDDSKKIGIHQTSINSEFSKEHGLLLSEIKLSKQNIRLSDSLTLEISESWAENSWEYQCFDDEIQIIKNKDIKNILIKLDSSLWTDYMDYYSIEFSNNYAGSQNGLITLDFDDSRSDQIFIYKLKNQFRFKGDKIVVDSVKIENINCCQH
jgi:hypothetical protein